jgi:hypothetical protein
MPNGGFDGSIEDFHRVEAPLVEIDPLLAQFAAARKLKLVKNYHNWPQRSLDWVSRGLNRSIQIVGVDAEKLTFHVAVIAWVDKEDQRYITHAMLKRDEPWDRIKDQFPALLEESFEMAESWAEKDLKPS